MARLFAASAAMTLVLTVFGGIAKAADDSFDAREQRNVDKSLERERYDWGNAAFTDELRRIGDREQAALVQTLAHDPERNPHNVCGVGRKNGCLGDVRLWDWQERGHGIVRPVLFTARDGATLSGRVWATRDGPARRPAVVFVTGSIQVPEAPYWFVATTLAKRGFVVLTFDVQGQGLSDTYGEGVDHDEGVPSQAGEPFFDGAEDGLDFMLATPGRPYRPRPSCTSGTDHSAKQARRVAAGLDAAYNPLWELVDPSRIGLAGQSLGAAAASFVGQKDARVKAIVALDNLDAPGSANFTGVTCPSAPDTRRPAPITRPALGISNDYFIAPTAYDSPPEPTEKSGASMTYSAAGVDSGQVNIRGGTHQECAFIPVNATRATLRGVDFCSWYLAAWFDKYLKQDPTADRRLLSRRWLSDPRDALIDPEERGNLFSFHFRSRMDIRLSTGGARARCEDLRAGRCQWLTADDARPPRFNRLTLGLSADGRRGPHAYDAVLRDGGAAIAQRVGIAVQKRSDGLFSVAVGPSGGPREIDRYELQLAGKRGWRLAGSSRTGLFTVRRPAGRGLLVRARAIDRLGGIGSWRTARPRH
jgi:dienelactone hydrolase